MLVALARNLLVALWRYVETGEVPAGARLAAACEVTGATMHQHGSRNRQTMIDI